MMSMVPFSSLELLLLLLLGTTSAHQPAASTIDTYSGNDFRRRIIDNNIEDDIIDLPFGDINVVVLTDVHTWIGGHKRHEPNYDADYGDILSFWEILKSYADSNNIDLWFVNNGDWVDGTGLSSGGDVSSLVPIIEKMPFDIFNCGNHELYDESIVSYMTRAGGFVDWWGDRYLTANIMLKQQQEDNNNDQIAEEPQLLGRQYKLLQGKNSNVLVYGFLYNLENPCNMIEVKHVEEVVKESWFINSLKNENYDAILILAHMDLVDPLVSVILQAIRNVIGDDIIMPIQFITGHTHYRGVQQIDPMTNTVEFGRYLDTIGFVSFPTAATLAAAGVITTPETTTVPSNNITNGDESSPLFRSKFLNASVETIQETLGDPLFDHYPTWNGHQLSNFIETTRDKLGLTDEIGCAPQDYDFQAPLDDPNSLWRLYRDVVIPQIFFGNTDNNNNNNDDEGSNEEDVIYSDDSNNTAQSNNDSNDDDDDVGKVMLLSNQLLRYNIYATSSLIVDDIWAVAPFNDTILHLGTFEGILLEKLNETLNANIWPGGPPLPTYIQIGQIDNPKHHYDLYTHEFNVMRMITAINKLVPNHHITPQDTGFSSTMIWLSFVIENWDCNGVLGQLPDWFPKPDQIANKIPTNGDGGIDNQSLLIIFGVFIFCILLGCCCCLRCICCGVGGNHQPLDQEDLDKYELDFDDDDYDDDYNHHDMLDFDDDDRVEGGQPIDNATAATDTLTDDDHEML